MFGSDPTAAGAPGHFAWRWTTTRECSSKLAYEAMFAGESCIVGVKELWKAKSPNKCRLFIWLTLLNRCWTGLWPRKQDLRDNNICPLCSEETESIDHLLSQCVFSREVWFKSLCWAGWHALSPMQVDSFVAWWLRVWKLVPKAHKSAFDSYVMLIAWTLWLERNSHVFRSISSLPVKVVDLFCDQCELWCQAGICTRSRLVAM
jgi:hypothetical protein